MADTTTCGDTHTHYLRFTTEPVARTRVLIADTVTVDLDARGLVVGIDILLPATDTVTFTCPRCSHVTRLPLDVLHGYCATCQDWTRP